ncbi:hypothetical protein Tco_0957908 [Tanacetum coccineum]
MVTFLMASSLPHIVEEIKAYVERQCDEDDSTRQEAINVVTELFDQAYAAKQALREQCASCKDIDQEKRDVIDKFLKDEASKDYKVERKLWKCVKKYNIISVTKSVRCTKKTSRMICVFVSYRNLYFYFNVVFYFDFNVTKFKARKKFCLRFAHASYGFM